MIIDVLYTTTKNLEEEADIHIIYGLESELAESRTGNLYRTVHVLTL
jgi:hypothetical protein